MVEEIWTDIPGYEGLYQASNTGFIKSLDKFRLHSKGGVLSLHKGRILSLCINQGGYYKVQLIKNYKVKHFVTHRLVALTFIPNNENKPHINHIDGIKTNNNINNLEWCTPKENSIHAVENNLINPKKGVNNPSSKQTCQYDLNGNLINIFSCTKEAGKSLKINPRTLSRVCQGIRPTYKGFIWRYFDNPPAKIEVDLTNKSFRKVNRLDLEGNILKTYKNMQEATLEGFRVNDICGVCRGRQKTHKGYKWQYA